MMLVGGGFPGGIYASVGDMGSIPGLGRSSMLWSVWAHGPQLLSLYPRAQKPRAAAAEGRMPLNLCCAAGEAATVRNLQLKKNPHSNEDLAQPPKKEMMLVEMCFATYNPCSTENSIMQIF